MANFCFTNKKFPSTNIKLPVLISIYYIIIIILITVWILWWTNETSQRVCEDYLHNKRCEENLDENLILIQSNIFTQGYIGSEEFFVFCFFFFLVFLTKFLKVNLFNTHHYYYVRENVSGPPSLKLLMDSKS